MTQESKKDDIDVKRHLLKIEARLDQLSTTSVSGFNSRLTRHDDEIDLREVWSVVWRGKWWIIGMTFLFAVGSVILALLLPNQYKAEITLAPAQEKTGMSSLAAQYGGLAAMAGISLGSGQSADVDQAIALMKSWPFLSDFVDKYELKPLVMAVDHWDATKNEVIYDRDIYDPATKQWLREPEPNRPAEPTSYEVYEALSKMIMVNQDVKTGLIRLSVEHYVPHVAWKWTELLVTEVNEHFRNRDVREAGQNIDYLRAKITETSIAEMQSVFYRMIEAQMKTLMLAEVSDEYLLKSVVPAVLPEKKSQPKRLLICILGTILGGMVGLFLIFVLHFRRSVAKSHAEVYV